MRHKILIYPDNNLRFLFQDLIPKLNSQYQFNFQLLDKLEKLEEVVTKEAIDFNECKDAISEFKSENEYDETDLVIMFTYNQLSDSRYNVTNLFLAGRGISDENKCTAIASLNNINWKLFSNEYNYEIQKHSLLHLLICALIPTYCEINPHFETLGCLLDINIKLSDFKEKISKGYFLCTEKECFDKVEKSKYGNSILQLCHTFKYTTTSNDYVNIPLNDIRSEIIRAKIDNEEYFQNLILKVYEYAVKKPIEEWGFYNFLWHENNPVLEKQAQIALNALFKIILEIRAINIGKENETACGFIDFLVTHNFQEKLFKVGIEVKNAHNQNIESSYLQLKQYLNSENTKYGILIILWYKNENFKEPNSFETKEALYEALNSIDKEDYKIKTLIIDCTKRISPSKMK